MLGNPFYERGMIRDPSRFFGRRRELREIFSCLRTRQCVSVVGDSKIGKSSLLHYITAMGKQELGDDVQLHYLDLQKSANEEDFCCQTIATLGGGGRTLHALRRALRRRRVVLCLDEFERFKEEGFGPHWPGLLRSLAQEPDLALVVATRQPLEVLFPDDRRTSPIYNIFTRFTLGPFTEPEAQQLLAQSLVDTGVTFSEEEIARLFSLTGRHPYHLQVAAWHLFAAKTKERAEWEEAYFEDLVGGYRQAADFATQARISDPDVIRVFISSTMSDMQPERQAVIEALWNLELTPVFAEDWGSRSGSPRDVCLGQVADCHIYLGIFWQRYGYIDPETNISATEEEYDQACQCRMPILTYVKNEAEEKRHRQLRRFLREISDWGGGHFLTFFDTPQELADRVKTDVMREVRKMARRGFAAQSRGT
jgi:hypothetical protein